MSDVVVRAGTATVLFTDLVSSTQVRTSLGDERADELRRAHDRVLREAMAAHAGTEVKGTGDGFLVTFGSAAEAVSAAVDMQRSINRLSRRSPVPIVIRVGISAGDVSWEDGDCFGTPVVEASRLCQAADGGAILVSEVVRLLAGSRGGHTFHPVGALDLKGLDAPLTAAEVAWHDPSDGARVPLPAALARESIVPFVGRDRELDRLRTAWKAAGDGAVRLVLVSGEPGVGKTRLVSEMARSAHADGAVVLFGRCDEDLALPYQPFVEALGEYVASAAPADLTEQVGPLGADLARLVPLVAERVPGLAEPLRADPETERFRLFEVVSGFVRAVASDAPVLLVLDDLHWAGKPELLLIRHVLRGAPAPVLVVGTYRDTDLDRRHPLAEVLGDLRREDNLERVDLGGLDVEEVADFLEAAAGSPLGTDGARLAREVWDETEGNPFFVGQVLRHLVESGAVVEVDGRWQRAAHLRSIGIPEGVRDVIGRRLATLSSSTNGVLAVAAVVGREFSLDVVREAAEAEADELLDALEEAEGAHLIELVPGAPRRRTFVHALLRSTLYDEIPTTRRLRLHRRVAQALEARAGAGDAPALAELARHYCEAAALGETDNAVRYSKAAAAEARARLAYEEAAALYERALAVLDPAAAADRRPRAELLVELARMQSASGERHLVAESSRVAADLARELGDSELFALAAIVRGGKRGWGEAGIVDEELKDQLEETLALLPDGDHPLRAQATARLASELYFLTEESSRRNALTDEAVAMARRCCSPEELGLVLSSAHWGKARPGNPLERLALAEEIVALGEESRDREVELSGLIYCVGDLCELGRVADARAVNERALANADEIHQPVYQWATRVQKAALLLLRGDHDAAEAMAEEALSFSRAEQAETAGQLFGVAHLHLARARGGMEALEPLVVANVERFPLVPAWRAGLVLAYRDLEKEDVLREQVDLLAADDFGLIPFDVSWTIATVISAMACGWLGDVDRCRSLYDKLTPLIGTTVVVGPPADCLGAVEAYLAAPAFVLGDPERAEEHYANGVAFNEKIDGAAGTATAGYEYAAVLHRHGGEKWRARAREVAAEVAEVADRATMPRIAARARALLD